MGRLVSGLAAGWVALGCVFPAALPAVDGAAWDDVDRFRGRYEARRLSGIEKHVPHYDQTSREEHVVTLDFEIERKSGTYTGSDWRTVSSFAKGSSTLAHHDEGTWDKHSSDSSVSYSGPVADDDIGFTLDTKAGTWEFGVNGRMKDSYVQVVSYRREKGSGGGRWQTETWEQSFEKTYHAHGGRRQPLPGPKPDRLFASWESREESDPARGDTTWHDYHWRISLYPVWPDYEVFVKVEGVGPKGESIPYEDWLPQGTVSGGVGARLKATARLERKGGGVVRAVVKQFRFELQDTSREPGICMNWPRYLDQTADEPKPLPDKEFDLRFDGRFGEATEKKQVQTVEPMIDAQGRPYAEAGIECFDYGAWSTLLVVAELADGRRITGHLEQDQAVSDILLPKRSRSSLVADAWKKRERVDLADDDDGEKDPEGEPGCDGDGLTLYEEYRGFFENGRHIHANPRRKDLFIFNPTGAEAAGGIALFQEMSGLELHPLLLEEEVCNHVTTTYTTGRHTIVSDDPTCINGYSDRGPHRVNQHLLRIYHRGPGAKWKGGATSSVGRTDEEKRYRPKDVDNIAVSSEGADVWTEQYGVSEADKPRQRDAAIAHELFHAVGVEHHGETDMDWQLEAEWDDPPAKTRASWRFWRTLVDASTVRIFDETTGKDVSEATAVRALRLFEKSADAAAAGDPDSVGLPGRLDEYVFTITIGGPHGLHSGDASCVMRYWFAAAYRKEGTYDAIYLVPDGTEPVGGEICSSAAGTLVNEQGRRPQPRYFDAAQGRGDCKHWVCVNDAIPAKSNEIPKAGK